MFAVSIGAFNFKRTHTRDILPLRDDVIYGGDRRLVEDDLDDLDGEKVEVGGEHHLADPEDLEEEEEEDEEISEEY